MSVHDSLHTVTGVAARMMVDVRRCRRYCNYHPGSAVYVQPCGDTDCVRACEWVTESTCIGSPVWRVCEAALDQAVQVSAVTSDGSILSSSDLEYQGCLQSSVRISAVGSQC